MTLTRIRFLLNIANGEKPQVPKGWTTHETNLELSRLVWAGYIESSSDDFNLTQKGKVFLQALSDVPAPVQAWTMP